MTIRHSNLSDIPYIMEIINQGKEYLLLQGIDQWQKGYPNEDSIKTDIESGHSYVVCDENSIIGTFMAAIIEEPTYNHIFDGEWLTDANPLEYMVVHRIAIDNTQKGKRITSRIMNYISTLEEVQHMKSIRIDTHEKNLAMQSALIHSKFQSCGIIYLSDGDKRIAFEREI